MRKKYYLALLCGLTFAFFSGCDAPRGGSPLAPPSGPILARVNDWYLTPDDFRGQIDEIIRLNGDNSVVMVDLLGPLARMLTPLEIEEIDLRTQEGKRHYLNLLINKELLSLEAKERGLHNEAQTARSLHQVRTEILSLSLFNELTRQIRVTPAEVEDFYENQYRRPLEAMQQRRIREIVVDSHARATGILVELLQGSDFSSLVRQHSVSSSASAAGDLGYLIPGPVPGQVEKFQRFWEAAATIEPGQVSSIFKHPEREEYYIIKVEDSRSAEIMPMSQIYDNIEEIVRQEKALGEISRLISGIKPKAIVDMNPGLL